MPHASEPTSVSAVESGEAWERLADTIRQMGDLVASEGVPDDPTVRADGYRYLLRYLAAGIRVCVESDDAAYPEFARMIENHMSWGLDNPDCSYSWARVEPGREPGRAYVIRGDLGTACHLEVQVNSGHFGDGNVGQWHMSTALGRHDIRIGDDGEVEIVLSATAPEHPPTGPPPNVSNWMPLADDASFILVRQYFNNWEAERPANLTIETVGASYPEPLLTTEALAQRLDRLTTWLTAGLASWDRVSHLITANDPGDIEPFLVPEGASGLQGQAYGMGAYNVERDRAVIIEFAPPDCRMWSVALADFWWSSPEFASRQSSLNGTQARLDRDGVFRAVIAREDPGVANWLDPCGHEVGTIGVRYLFPESSPRASYRTVDLANLSNELPPDTAMVDARERREILERRRRAVQSRYGY